MEREGGAWAGNGAKCPMDGRSALMRPCPTFLLSPYTNEGTAVAPGSSHGAEQQGWHGRALQDLTPRAEPALLFQEQPARQCGSSSSPARCAWLPRPCSVPGTSSSPAHRALSSRITQEWL